MCSGRERGKTRMEETREPKNSKKEQKAQREIKTKK